MLITFGGFLGATLLYIIITIFLVNYRNVSRAKSSLPGWNYFVAAFTVKAISSIMLGVIFQYYYGYGDTIGYYKMGNFLIRLLNENVSSWGKVMFSTDMQYFTNLGDMYEGKYAYFFHPNSITVARFYTLFSPITRGNYLPSAIFFALFSFTGSWAMYRVFCRVFPSLYRPFAIAILFIPSVCFWGSGVLKDSLTFGSLGILMHGCYMVFIVKKKIIPNILLIVISVYIALNIKPYVVFSFLPAMIAWAFLDYRSRIKNAAFKAISLPLVLLTLVVLFGLLNNYITENFEKYSVENVVTTATSMSSSIAEFGDIGKSSYSLYVDSDVEGLGYLKLVIPAYIVTFFRPFPWEAHNFLSVLSVMESICFILLTLYTLRRIGIVTTYRMVFKYPVVLFCFLFSAIFGIAVGVASENFGTLSRYKIPCMPYYLACFIIINYLYDGRVLFAGRKMADDGQASGPVAYADKDPTRPGTLPSGWARAAR